MQHTHFFQGLSILCYVLLLSACSNQEQLSKDFSVAKKDLQRATTQQEQQDAVHRIEVLANRGSPDAQVLLGYFAIKGQFIEKNEVHAVQLFQDAAEAGNRDAQYNLGLAYVRGMGTEKDLQKAQERFLLAAEKGDIGAQYNLGLMYAAGEGIPQDSLEAFVWLSHAKQGGHPDAGKVLSQLEQKMSEAEIAKAQRRLKRSTLKSS